MTTGKAIVISSAIIAASILAHLAYTVSHDRTVAAAAQLEQERQAKAAAEQSRLTQGKMAWDVATKGLDHILQNWLETQVAPEKAQYVDAGDMVLVKTYQHSDVTWENPKHVTVSGVIYSYPKTSKDAITLSWKRAMQKLDDGNWSDPTFNATFGPCPLPKAETDKLTTTVLRWRGIK